VPSLSLTLGGCIEPARSADAPSLPARPEAARSAPSPAEKTGQPEAEAKAADGAPLGSDASAEQRAEPASNGSAAATVQGELDAFLVDTPDAPLRAALAHENIKTVERGRGGRSLGFKIVLADGHKAYFKAEQTFSAANWFGEVAAYHLDRMLGLGRVPCVVSREFDWDKLVGAAGKDPRKEEVIVHDGKVRGAFVAWVTGELGPLKQAPGWERWIRVRYWPSTAVSPFQRPAVWKRQLDLSRKQGDSWRTKEDRFRRRNMRPEPDTETRPGELSDLIVFDYLTRNLDRWGGDNANVLVRGKRGPLVFLDNGAGFEPGDPRPSLMEARLHALQRFRRRTIEAVRAFDGARYEQRLASEAVQPVLTSGQIAGLAERRKGLLEWIAEMESVHGQAIWAFE
jgi:Golgi casein kinase, C-terminal, Fam20